MDIPTPPGILTDDEYEQIMGAGGPAAAPESERSFWLAQVNQYRAFRVSAPREKDLEAQRQRLSRLDALALDPDGEAKRLQLDTILTAAPEQQAAAKDALLIDSMLAERASRRVTISGSVWDANKPPSVLAVDRDAARDALAVETFGETAPRGSDAAVAGKLREAAQARRNLAWLVGGKDGADEQSRKINEASLARWATRAGLAGESATAAYAAWQEQAKASPAWTAEAATREMWPVFAQQYQNAKASAEPLRKKVTSVFEKLLALSQSDKSAAMGLPDFLEAVAPIEDIDTATLRQVVLPMIRAMAETRKDEEGRDFWAKIEDSFRRPIDRALGSAWDSLTNLLQGSATQEFPQEGLAEELAAEQMATNRRNVARALLREVTSSTIDPILTTAKTKAGKMAEQMVYDVAGSLGFMAMAAIPYAGAVLNAAGFADDNLANLLNQSPTLKPDDARALAWAAAPVQAGLEKVQQLGLMGRLPGFNRTLNRLAGPGGNPLARFAMYGAVATGVEYTIEKLQDASPMWAQDILASMKADVPIANWDGFERFDLRTLLAVAPLALIGAGVNVARDASATRALLASEDAMRAVGMTEEAIDAVIQAPTIAAKVDAVREGYATRDAAAQPDVAWQNTVAGAVANSEAKAAIQLQDDFEAAGIRKAWKVKDGGFVIIDNAGQRYDAATSEEAAQIVNRLANDAAAWDEIAPIFELSELLDQRAAAPTQGSETTVMENRSVASILDEQTAIMEDSTIPGRERVRARRFVRSLMERVDIYEQMAGKKVDLTKIMVAGMSEMETRNGVATAVVRVGRGASPYVVLEERVEADVTAMLRSGDMTVADAAAMVRDVEARTGEQFLAGYTDGADAAKDALAVKEAISLLTQVYVTGRGIAGRQAAAIPQFLRDYRKATRAKLKAAEAAGAAPAVFAYLKSRVEWMKAVLRQAITLNRAIREARAAGEPLALEEFLQRVTGIAPQVEAAREVEQETAVVYIPPPDEDLMPFNLWSFSMQEGLAAHKLTPEELEGFRLSALHNLTLDNLRHADRLGTLPVPSIAVVPVGQSIEGFGEITLIGSRALGDPAQVPVFDSDAYTARFPRAVYRTPPYKEWSSLLKKIRPFDRKFQDGLEGYADQYMQRGAADELMQRVGDSWTAAAMYLAEEHGMQFEPVQVAYTPTNRWIEDREFLDAADNGALSIATDNEVDRKAFGEILRRVINRYYDAIAAGKDAGRARQLVEIMRDATLAKWIEEDGQSRPDLWSLTHDVQQLGSTVLDQTATEKILRDALFEDNRHAGFQAWAERTFMAPFGEPRMELNGKKVPFTLDNIVASMTSADPRGKEVMFGKPLGYWRGYSAQRFTDVEQMRTRAASNIIPKADTAPAHAESKKAVMDWSAKVTPFYKGQYAMEVFNDAMATIAKYLRGRRTPAAFRTALETEGFRAVPDDVVTQGIEAAEKFANAPVPYFEAKPQRAVRLSEFPTAVVWEDTSEEAVQILESHGVTVVRAPASGRDDPATKQKILSDAIRGSGLSFSLQPISQISPFSKKDDKFRVGTSLKVVAKVPQPAPGTSNIDFDNVPLEVLEKHMSQLDYAHLPADILEEQDARTKADKFVAWMRDNLLALHDAFPQDVRARATQWYDGANRIAKRLGKKWKYTPQQAAGVMAVLSPQKDWFKNVAQAEQVFDIWNTERDTVFTQQILDTAGEDIAQAAEAAPNELRKKKTKPGKKESKLARTRRMNYNRRLHEEAKQLRRDLFAPLKGKTIADLDSDPILQAWAIRMMAQYKFGGAYNALSPEGDQLGFVFTKSGSPAVNAWGSCNEIIKCVNILKDGSPVSISSQLGEEHKVRSFYNNIIAPNSPFGDTTMDTHAVAAAHLMPFSASDLEVRHNLGGAASSKPLGISGMYHLYLKAYRDAAALRGLQPRQMQSITWEAVRLLYPAAEKSSQNLVEKVAKIWQSGEDVSTIRERILSRGIPSPVWARTDNGGQSGSGPAALSEEGDGLEPGADLRAGGGPAARTSGRGRGQGGVSFSLQPEDMLDSLATQVGTTMNRAPQARLEMVGRARDNLTALKDSFLRGRTGGFTPERSVASLQSEQDMRQAVREQELLQAAGVSLTSAQDIRIGRADAYRAELANQLAARGVEEKSPQRIRREANFRQALEREKMLAQTDEDYSRSLSQIYREFGFWDGTVMSFLSRKTKGTRTGILMSYRKAQRFAGKGEFVNHGPWDGSEELPRILFSGTTQPDVAAMELFSAHPEVFPSGTTATDVTPDMLWDAIGRELAENEKLAGVWDDYQKAVKATEQQAKDWGDAWVENYRRQLAEARADAERAGNAYVAEATGNNTQAVAAAAQARQEAADWRKRADRWQAADWNDKAVLTRAMRTLDAILAAFPPDIRGKVGGWLSLARLGSAESMAKEIGRRIDMLDRELEKSLRADAIEEIRALVDRAMPTRKPGEKPTGKLGAEAHRYFDAVAAVLDLSAADVDARRVALEQELADAATPEEQANAWEKQQILDTFGGLEAMKDRVPLHDAADLEAALAQAQQVYQTGRNYWRTIEEARLADVAAKVAGVSAALPAAKTSAILAQGDAAKRISGMLKGGVLRLRSFREILT
ncbi:MAG: hypothetical protein ACK5VI_00940, partial [Opitutia bacterium]